MSLHIIWICTHYTLCNWQAEVQPHILLPKPQTNTLICQWRCISHYLYCVIMCCIVSPRFPGINERYALLAVSGCFFSCFLCVSLPLVVPFLLLGFSGFHWFHLCLLLSGVYPHSAFSSFLLSVHSLFLLCSSHMFLSSQLCFLCYFDLFWVYFCIFFTHLNSSKSIRKKEKKTNLILRLSFLIFHLWPVVHDPSSVAH